MAAVRFGPGQILEYNSRHGVLICHECQYAIQKSALQSHLLRHKIYRSERQQLLEHIAQFNIFEPESVPLPPPESPPIDGLPVISGYRCTAPSCVNLCASLKRMKGHWKDCHGVADFSLPRPAKLQTFFRGTKISYFEVTLDAGDDAAEADSDSDQDDEDEEGDDIEEQEDDEHLSPAISHSTPSMIVDLETLFYFHNFTSETSLTLPSPQSLLTASQYWQTWVLPQALRQDWLMCGLLALSACHLATFPENPAVENQHRQHVAELCSRFRTGWEEFTVTACQEVRESATQVECLLRCAHWALAESPFDGQMMPEPGTPDQLQRIMTTLQASIPLAAQHPSGLETPAYALRILSWGSSEPGSFSPGNNMPVEIRDRLRDLPTQMANTFGKPENTQDVLVHLSAIATLAECCNSSFASDDIGSAWWGMAMWLAQVPPQFKDLVARYDPASLVVVAHWAALLVSRAERCGCWYVRGLAMAILLQIAERLPKNDSGSVLLLVALINTA